MARSLPGNRAAGVSRGGWRTAILALGAASLTVEGACGGPPRSPTATMGRFNAALCPKAPGDDLSLPLDPNLDGVTASLGTGSRSVASASLVRLILTFRNAGLHGITLALPRQAFTLAGFDLVDHDCVRVAYAAPPAARALAYGDSGPMPLNAGESATIDSSLGDLAPGLVLTPGIYAIRLALRTSPNSAVVRGRTLTSDWTLFAVLPPR